MIRTRSDLAFGIHCPLTARQPQSIPTGFYGRTPTAGVTGSPAEVLVKLLGRGEVLSDREVRLDGEVLWVEVRRSHPCTADKSCHVWIVPEAGCEFKQYGYMPSCEEGRHYFVTPSGNVHLTVEFSDLSKQVRKRIRARLEGRRPNRNVRPV